jgi:hypothetical protein
MLAGGHRNSAPGSGSGAGSTPADGVGRDRPLPHAGAGATTAHPEAPAPSSSWPEGFIGRREAARAFLRAWRDRGGRDRGLDGHYAANLWNVPGWRGLFDDHALIELARRAGWRG